MTFGSLPNGLPQGDIQDIIHRHGLVTDGTGQRLPMEFTTGGLSVSDGQGATWQMLSAHPPPIARLTFAP